MNQQVNSFHFTDHDGNPTGGHTHGVGICIAWQHGPLGRGVDRQKPNGAFVEGVINAAIDRLESFQRSKFECTENRLAIMHLKDALTVLNDRTQRREKVGVEGTHAL